MEGAPRTKRLSGSFPKNQFPRHLQRRVACVAPPYRREPRAECPSIPGVNTLHQYPYGKYWTEKICDDPSLRWDVVATRKTTEGLSDSKQKKGPTRRQRSNRGFGYSRAILGFGSLSKRPRAFLSSPRCSAKECKH